MCSASRAARWDRGRSLDVDDAVLESADGLPPDESAFAQPVSHICR